MEIYAALIFGFLGSLHCLGMCGPIVLAYSLPLAGTAPTKTGWVRRQAPHALYNLGRITTYTGLGAVAGGVGDQMFRAGNWMGIERWMFIALGIVLFAVGLVLAKVIPMPQAIASNPLSRLPLYQTTVGKLMTSASLSTKYPLGVLMGFLPCHLIYAMLLQAAATGNIRTGALLMLAFGFGTAPALVGMGVLSQFLSTSMRAWGDRLVTSGVFLLALMLLLRGAGYNVMPCHQSHASQPAQTQTAPATTPAQEPAEPHCH
ncbi:MAG: sulfite exporter TauE/SafE family protein [Blastocatellia bacterium]|nr:sulfite exporter TauE/SafE family protein [Blastocatellia bacterium]